MLIHIKHHLGEIGLRHYIDWVMYVKKVCNNTFWNEEFCYSAEKFDLTKLAKALTKSGKRYFPLDDVTWCDDIDISLSDDLLNEFYQSGNFNVNLVRQKALTLLSSDRNVFYWIKYISIWGVENWKPAQKYHALVPIAFFIQLFRYVKLYFSGGRLNLKTIKKEIISRKRINTVLK